MQMALKNRKLIDSKQQLLTDAMLDVLENPLDSNMGFKLTWVARQVTRQDSGLVWDEVQDAIERAYKAKATIDSEKIKTNE